MRNVKVGNPDTIIRILGRGNYSLIYRKDRKPEMTCYTLKCYEQLLPDFVRISKAHLINPSFVQSFQTIGRDCSVVLYTGDEIPVSRRKESLVCYRLNTGEFERRRQLAV